MLITKRYLRPHAFNEVCRNFCNTTSRPSAYVTMMWIAGSTKVIGGDGLCWLSSLFIDLKRLRTRKTLNKGGRSDQMTIPSTRFNIFNARRKSQCDVKSGMHKRKSVNLVILVTHARIGTHFILFILFYFFSCFGRKEGLSAPPVSLCHITRRSAPRSFVTQTRETKTPLCFAFKLATPSFSFLITTGLY